MAMSCGVGHRCGSDLVLLWLWCMPVATAPIQPLAWEPPHAAGVALKRKKEKKESRVAMSCGVGHRCGSDPELRWLWRRLVAVALIQPLTWELPYTSGAALKNKKQTNKKSEVRSKTILPS